MLHKLLFVHANKALLGENFKCVDFMEGLH